MVSEVAALHEIKHEIESFSVLESIVHVDNKRGIQGGQQFLLIDDTLDTFLRQDSSIKGQLH